MSISRWIAYCWFCLGMCCLIVSGLIAGKDWFNDKMAEVYDQTKTRTVP